MITLVHPTPHHSLFPPFIWKINGWNPPQKWRFASADVLNFKQVKISSFIQDCHSGYSPRLEIGWNSTMMSFFGCTEVLKNEKSGSIYIYIYIIKSYQSRTHTSSFLDAILSQSIGNVVESIHALYVMQRKLYYWWILF